MHDTDEGITVLPIHLSGVKSDENVGRHGRHCQKSVRLENPSLFRLETFPGAYECCNFAESCIYGDKRGDCVLHSCFARWKRLFIVDSVKNWSAAVSGHMCYTTCVLSAFLWIFFAQTVEGVKGEVMRCHRP
jgi:hypothetical protein